MRNTAKIPTASVWMRKRTSADVFQTRVAVLLLRHIPAFVVALTFALDVQLTTQR